ncbi:MAG: septum formation initiator family protein [Synergistaceae bacterium]|jgi:cell division protein FtsB|nr:septum formation initiator family protein [Synergistaceae bacterium]
MPRLRWIFVAAISTLFFFIVGTIYFFEIQKIARLRLAVAERTAKLSEKKRSIKNYREKVNFYETTEGIAHFAREQYNLAFPGERVYVIQSVSSDVSLYTDS